MEQQLCCSAAHLHLISSSLFNLPLPPLSLSIVREFKEFEKRMPFLYCTHIVGYIGALHLAIKKQRRSVP